MGSLAWYHGTNQPCPGDNEKGGQIPPDLVVKSQAIDIIGLILSRIRRKTSSKHRVDQGNRALSCSHYLRVISLPLNSMESDPAYVTWETFERIEAILAENYATYGQNKR